MIKNLFFILFVFGSFLSNAKGKFIATLNYESCDACFAHIGYLNLLDSNKFDVIYLFESKYEADKEDIKNVYSLKNVTVKYMFDDSLYAQLINNRESTYTVVFGNNIYSQGYIKGYLTQKKVEDINQLAKDRGVFTDVKLNISATAKNLSQYRDRIEYVLPLKHAVISIDILSEGKVDTLALITPDLVRLAYTKQLGHENSEKQLVWLNNNMLKPNAKLQSFRRGEHGDIWVYATHEVLLPNGSDTGLLDLMGLYHFSAQSKFLNYYPIEVMKSGLEEMKYELPNYFIPKMNEWFIRQDTLYTHIARYDSSTIKNRFFLATYTLQEDEFKERMIYSNLLPKAYDSLKYNLCSTQFDPTNTYFTLPLDDKLYYIEGDKLKSITLNLFSNKTEINKLTNFPNNIIDRPFVYGNKIYCMVVINTKYHIAIIDPLHHKVTELIDVDKKVKYYQSERIRFMMDQVNPDYFWVFSKNGSLEHVKVVE